MPTSMLCLKGTILWRKRLMDLHQRLGPRCVLRSKPLRLLLLLMAHGLGSAQQALGANRRGTSFTPTQPMGSQSLGTMDQSSMSTAPDTMGTLWEKVKTTVQNPVGGDLLRGLMPEPQPSGLVQEGLSHVVHAATDVKASLLGIFNGVSGGVQGDSAGSTGSGQVTGSSPLQGPLRDYKGMVQFISLELKVDMEENHQCLPLSLRLRLDTVVVQVEVKTLFEVDLGMGILVMVLLVDVGDMADQAVTVVLAAMVDLLVDQAVMAVLLDMVGLGNLMAVLADSLVAPLEDLQVDRMVDGILANCRGGCSLSSKSQ